MLLAVHLRAVERSANLHADPYHPPTRHLQLAWQLGSPLFGLLLKHYAPSDTYKIWKVRRHQSRRGCAELIDCLRGMTVTADPGRHPPAVPVGSATGTCLVQLCTALGVHMHRYINASCTAPQVGNRLRVDGTLMGVEEKKRTLIPRWKRGHFSLLVNGGALHGAGAEGGGATWSRGLWTSLRCTAAG